MRHKRCMTRNASKLRKPTGSTNYRQTSGTKNERERGREIDKVPTRAAIMRLQIGHWGALFLPKNKAKNTENTQYMLDTLLPCK